MTLHIGIVAALLAIGQAAHAQEIEVSIRTTDASGAPIPNALVATKWWLQDGKLAAPGGPSATTDDSGKATLKMPTPTKAIYLLAYDKELRYSGYAQLPLGAKEVEIRLSPVAILRQKFNLKDKVDFFPDAAYNLWIRDQDGTVIAYWGGVTLSADVEVPLPAGSYRLLAVLSEEIRDNRSFGGFMKLESGQHLTLDPREIELSESAKTWGVRAYPTEYLIDPQGRIVRTQDAKKYLEGQLMKR